MPLYSEAFDAAASELRSSESRAVAERSQVPRLLAEILDASPARRAMLLRNSRRFRTLAFCQALTKASHTAGRRDGVEALELAELACDLADQLETSEYPQAPIEDVRARAWAQRANALRIQADYQASQAAFQQAGAHLQAGTGDPLDRAAVLRMLALLRKMQNQLDEGAMLLREAVSLYQSIGDTHREGMALVSLAGIEMSLGEAKNALKTLTYGVSLLDVEAEPLLKLATLENLAEILIANERYDEAMGSLRQARSLLERVGVNQAAIGRHSWLEGRIRAGQGEALRAENSLLMARQSFVRLGNAANVSWISLDLALIYAAQGRSSDLRALMAEVIPLFESRGLHEDALAALLLLGKAAEAERVTVALVKEVSDFLERAESNPKLRFRPSSN